MNLELELLKRSKFISEEGETGSKTTTQAQTTEHNISQ